MTGPLPRSSAARAFWGHAGASEAEERYRGETSLSNKLGAIVALPATTANLLPEPVKLRPMVVRQLRKPRAPVAASLAEATFQVIVTQTSGRLKLSLFHNHCKVWDLEGIMYL